MINELDALGPDEFTAFFHAVHGHAPFPWQSRLLQQVAVAGWPDILDLPTGSGKTAALDVAVFALALEANRTSRRAPIRIIYVVDRRTIVDQAYERACRIQDKLLSGNIDILRRVRGRLATYTHEALPLQTALLRGGIAQDDSWVRTPDQPLIAVSTVDQVGSRLLFRGYGVSDTMKPVHAGLLGCDALYLLDEVHLSQPFRETLSAVSRRYRTWAERTLPMPFVTVEMSATHGDSSDNTFVLDDLDRTHPLLKARLESSKPAMLVATNARRFPNDIEQYVVSMLTRPGATIAVVVNRVKSAREIHQRLRESPANSVADIHLLTGRMRPFDRDLLEETLLQRIRAGRTRGSERPVVVVATQSIEAGADFDFDGLITECASLDALRQRFGRLDRLGTLAGSAQAVIVARADTLKDDPVYGAAIGRTWKWLQDASVNNIVDFGITRLVVPSDAERLGLLAPKESAPVLLPSHLDAWVQTAPTPDADPDVSLWLHGPRRGLADVQVVWRADLTDALLKQASDGGGSSKNATALTIGMVESLPPTSAEAMSVPFLSAKRWLEGRSEPESFDVEGAVDVDEDALAAELQAPPRAAVRWQGDKSAIIRGSDLRPGQTIVVPSTYGGIGHGSWNPGDVTPVRDIAELANIKRGRRPVFRLHPGVVRHLFAKAWPPAQQISSPEELPVPRPGEADVEVLDDRQAVVDWLRATVGTTEGTLHELLTSLGGQAGSLRIEVLPAPANVDISRYFLVSGRRRPSQLRSVNAIDDSTSTEPDADSSLANAEVPLTDHLKGVATFASGFAVRLGLDEDLVTALRVAGEWHDSGKADTRFQRWLHGGSEFKALVQSSPLAKGSVRLATRLARAKARERSGYPAGARHELMSLVLMASATRHEPSRINNVSLVQHLIASHHGYCRPFAPWAADTKPVEVVFESQGITCKASSAHELARFDSGIADRFWQMVRTYGWWGLAWLETLLRLADHRQSEHEQTARPTSCMT